MQTAALDYARGLGLKWPEQGIAVTLSTYADEKGVAWPSLDTLSQGCGVNVRRLYKALDNLEALGVIDRDRGGGRGTTSRYRFTMAAPVAETDDLRKLIMRPSTVA